MRYDQPLDVSELNRTVLADEAQIRQGITDIVERILSDYEAGELAQLDFYVTDIMRLCDSKW